MPAVSLVVPVYNVERYIDRCIISILEQSFSDFEVLLINDCSTDNSMSAVKRFARNDSRMVILSHERNRGLAAARNTGVEYAKSDRITFVDSDDFIAPNLLETMMAASEGGRFDLVETGVEAIDENENLLWRYEPEPGQIEDLARNPDTILKVQEWGVTQKLWRTELFRNDLKFPEGAYWEDISVVPSLLVAARNLVKVPFVGYSYLQRPTSISNTKSVKHVLDIFRAFERYRKYLKARGLFEAYRPTFSRVVENGAKYQISQFKQHWLGLSSVTLALVQLCEVLLDEYVSERAVIDRLSEAQFNQLVNGAGASDPGLADRFRAEIHACSGEDSVG
jgi:glycosyltransferase involved in cell wall biosynthesis